MKTLYKLIIVLLFPIATFAKPIDETIVKEKSYSKSYATNADATAEINNKFGSITVVLTNENKISIDVNVKVTGSSESRVEKKLNSIDVDFSNSSSIVSAKTTFDSDGDSNSYESINIEINYLVKIPKNGNIDLSNKYGSIKVDELNGTSKIEIKYGSFTLGQFRNKSNVFEMGYSTNSSIDFIDTLTLDIKYSKLKIDKNYGIFIDGNYNDFLFQNVGIVKFNGNYSKIKSSTMVQMDCDGNYLTLNLGEIGQADINSNYSTINMSANSKTKNISVDANYSKTNIVCDNDYSFEFEIAVNYGSLNTNLDLNYSEKSEKNTSKYYVGTRNGKSKSKIKANSNYGSVSLLNK